MPRARSEFVATIAEDAMLPWESQVGQYPADGPPGISYCRGRVTDDYFVDCLLYRDEDGRLIGILNHYPTDFPPLQRKGTANVWVHPDHRRQGVASALGFEKVKRWGTAPPDQDRTPDGAAMANAVGHKIFTIMSYWR